MPSSGLEDRLRKQLAALGETASDTDIARLLEDKSTRAKLSAIDPTYQRSASALDVLGTTLWHVGQSSTAGLLGLATDSEFEKQYGLPWDQKTSAERIGASIGEVAGFFTPGGAFPTLAKVSGKAVGRLTGMGTKVIIKRSAKEAPGIYAKGARLTDKAVNDGIASLNKGQLKGVEDELVGAAEKFKDNIKTITSIIKDISVKRDETGAIIENLYVASEVHALYEKF